MGFLQLAHRFRIVDAVGTVSIHRYCNMLDVGKLGRPLDLAVAGEDLLDQRGSGSWQPNDENWLRRGMPQAGSPGQESPAEYLDDAVMQHLVANGIIVFAHPAGRIPRAPPVPGTRRRSALDTPSAAGRGRRDVPGGRRSHPRAYPGHWKRQALSTPMSWTRHGVVAANRMGAPRPPETRIAATGVSEK